MYNYKFIWSFNEEEFEECKKTVDGDYLGNIRVGDMCFDIMQREDDDACLWIDCYVGGVDTGYGYSKDYPYDYVSGVGMALSRDEYMAYTYEQFVKAVERELTRSINEHPTYTADNGETVNLIDKASGVLHIW